MKNLTSKELELVQTLVKEFNQAKIQLGDTVISQNNLIEKVSGLKVAYSKQEAVLIKKYGKDAVINIENGEVTSADDKPDMTSVK
tara:strand:- start:1065 stop:1319 length:255 start_codon:yes stop_codon:yes gene_type:complete